MAEISIKSSDTAEKWCEAVRALNEKANAILNEVQNILNTLAGSDEGTIANQVYTTTSTFKTAFAEMGAAFGGFVDTVLSWFKENKDTVKTVVETVATATKIIAAL